VLRTDEHLKQLLDRVESLCAQTESRSEIGLLSIAHPPKNQVPSRAAKSGRTSLKRAAIATLTLVIIAFGL
jgi:hypothetical protein